MGFTHKTVCMVPFEQEFAERKPPAWLISCQAEWVVGMQGIFYLNKHHPFAPYNWLAHISCCLLVINYFRWKWQGYCAITVQHFLCEPQTKEWWDVSVSKSICWNSGFPAVTHAQTAPEILLCYGRKVSVIEWPPLLIYWEERMRCQNKNGNRLEYIKWCGVSTGLEPILPDSLKLSWPRISSGERARVGFGGLWEEWKMKCTQSCVRSKSPIVGLWCHKGGKKCIVFVCWQTTDEERMFGMNSPSRKGQQICNGNDDMSEISRK